jgi:succinate-semialdehyde dehydrogenase/glutarate-semialdehyde dehydrogenase
MLQSYLVTNWKNAMSIQTINPATETIINTYSLITQAEADQIIDDTYADYLSWRDLSIDQRAANMRRAAELLKEHKIAFAKLMAEEMGKPITAGIAETEKCAWVCEYYADHAAELLKPHYVKTDFKKSYVTYQPNGVIFAIMPWNFPLWQVFRFAVPNLMAGQGCLLKHASISTGTALAIEKLFRDAGFLKNIFRTLVINVDLVPYVIAHPKVSGVTLTGSEDAGMKVASAAGKALKKVVLELGGNDPYVVLADADLNHAAEICITSRLANSGQVCIAAKRLIVVDAIFAQFEMLVLEKIRNYKLGDPLQKDTNLGPLARADLRDKVQQQVQETINQGAKLLVGGKIPSGKGFYYPITVLTEVKPGMVAFDDEIFGPVLALVRAKDEADAIALANNSRYGLGAAVFTQDLAHGEKIAAEKIQAGSCAVNTFVKSDPRLPFGGTKHSGFGRELAEEGIHAFMNIKTLTVA